MPERAASSTILALLLSVSLAPALAAQDLPEAEVKEEVRAAWDAYIEAFSTRRTDVIAADVYS
ncbi:MAG: hypothetical protein J4F37_06060, partial [Acidobacteria bacterium]|nr:hypothetical protein [Acidobacteriota bacterium]